EEIFLSDVPYTSQFDASIFSLCTGCWNTMCCRRATEYMMGNTNIANCTDTTIATSAPYMTVLGTIITSRFSDNTTKYTKETYNATSLDYDAKNAKDAVDYMIQRLRANKPVLIGVHYTNGGKPPNNNNRATRHFMVVVGMTAKGESVSFRFYDPGRSMDYIDQATSINNLLKYDADKGYIQGQYFNKTYTISEIVKTQ
ncbi:MAG TPA: C39 family peptidase, partial [Chryseosolibacter sp.]|nr:C39 family peptidase [Chryseosolibacter sp.]